MVAYLCSFCLSLNSIHLNPLQTIHLLWQNCADACVTRINFQNEWLVQVSVYKNQSGNKGYVKLYKFPLTHTISLTFFTFLCKEV